MIARTAGISVAEGTDRADDQVLRRIEPELAVELLGCRQVDLRLALALEAANADVADHANDGAHGKRHGELPADRILVGEVLAGERLAHDRNVLGVERIAGGHVAALQQGRAHGVEESRRDEPQAGASLIARVWRDKAAGLFGSGVVVRIGQIPPRIVMGRKLM